MADTLVAWGQNGEALRPEQGYPLRLVVPGWEGNINVKWLRRMQAVEEPYMARDETSHYTDLMPDGTARIFTFDMEAKSLITYPSGGHQLKSPGFVEITGLAWSGRGRIERVEISTDGGAILARRRAAGAAPADGVHALPPAMDVGRRREPCCNRGVRMRAGMCSPRGRRWLPCAA